MKGTPAFQPPEVFTLEAGERYRGFAADIWAVGATLHAMVVGVPPYMADNEWELVEKLKSEEFRLAATVQLDPHLRNLLLRCLTKDPNRRITLAAIMTHDWVTEEGSDPLLTRAYMRLNLAQTTVATVVGSTASSGASTALSPNAASGAASASSSAAASAQSSSTAGGSNCGGAHGDAAGGGSVIVTPATDGPGGSDIFSSANTASPSGLDYVASPSSSASQSPFVGGSGFSVGNMLAPVPEHAAAPSSGGRHHHVHYQQQQGSDGVTGLSITAPSASAPSSSSTTPSEDAAAAGAIASSSRAQSRSRNSEGVAMSSGTAPVSRTSSSSQHGTPSPSPLASSPTAGAGGSALLSRPPRDPSVALPPTTSSTSMASSGTNKARLPSPLRSRVSPMPPSMMTSANGSSGGATSAASGGAGASAVNRTPVGSGTYTPPSSAPAPGNKNNNNAANVDQSEDQKAHLRALRLRQHQLLRGHTGLSDREKDILADQKRVAFHKDRAEATVEELYVDATGTISERPNSDGSTINILGSSTNTMGTVNTYASTAGGRGGDGGGNDRSTRQNSFNRTGGHAAGRGLARGTGGRRGSVGTVGSIASMGSNLSSVIGTVGAPDLPGPHLMSANTSFAGRSASGSQPPSAATSPTNASSTSHTSYSGTGGAVSATGVTIDANTLGTRYSTAHTMHASDSFHLMRSRDAAGGSDDHDGATTATTSTSGGARTEVHAVRSLALSTTSSTVDTRGQATAGSNNTGADGMLHDGHDSADHHQQQQGSIPGLIRTRSRTRRDSGSTGGTAATTPAKPLRNGATNGDGKAADDGFADLIGSDAEEADEDGGASDVDGSADEGSDAEGKRGDRSHSHSGSGRPRRTMSRADSTQKMSGGLTRKQDFLMVTANVDAAEGGGTLVRKVIFRAKGAEGSLSITGGRALMSPTNSNNRNDNGDGSSSLSGSASRRKMRKGSSKMSTSTGSKRSMGTANSSIVGGGTSVGASALASLQAVSEAEQEHDVDDDIASGSSNTKQQQKKSKEGKTADSDDDDDGVKQVASPAGSDDDSDGSGGADDGGDGEGSGSDSDSSDASSEYATATTLDDMTGDVTTLAGGLDSLLGQLASGAGGTGSSGKGGGGGGGGGDGYYGADPDLLPLSAEEEARYHAQRARGYVYSYEGAPVAPADVAAHQDEISAAVEVGSSAGYGGRKGLAHSKKKDKPRAAAGNKGGAGAGNGKGGKHKGGAHGGGDSDDSDVDSDSDEHSDSDDSDLGLDDDDGLAADDDDDDLGLSKPVRGGKHGGKGHKATGSSSSSIDPGIDAHHSPVVLPPAWDACVSNDRFVSCPVGANPHLRLSFGCADSVGRRATMEDRSVAIPSLRSTLEATAEHVGAAPVSSMPGDLAFFAVYDGHNGTGTSEALGQAFHFRLAARLGLVKGEPSQPDPPATRAVDDGPAFVDASLEIDNELQMEVSPGEPISGSTAIMMLIREEPAAAAAAASAAGAAGATGAAAGKRSASPAPLGSGANSGDDSSNRSGSATRATLTIANVGDSRAVLCRSGHVIDLSVDHKCSRPDERARIEAAGGTVIKDRLHGVLAVSRAFGDAEHKRLRGSEMWGREFYGDPLTAQPEVSVHALDYGSVPAATITTTTSPGADEFVVLACDGVWDVMTSAQVVNFTRRRLAVHRDVARAARELVQKALDLNSIDNISVIVVGFS